MNRNLYRIISSVTLVVPLLFGTAVAKDKISSTIVEEAGHAGDFHLTKPGNSLKIAPAPKSPGTALVMQLILKNVDCVLEGNDKGKAGKCGVVGTGQDAVLDVVIHSPSGDIHVGIPIEFEKGQAKFIATAKNKIDGSLALGAAVSGILGQPITFDVVKVREEGSNPADCATIPLSPGNGCVDGNEFAVTGITTSP